MTASSPRGWVKLSTSIFHDYDFGQLSLPAQHLFLLLLPLAGWMMEGGRIPADPKRLAFPLHRSHDVDGVASALSELLTVGLVVETDDPDWLAIRSWAKHQPQMRGDAADRVEQGRRYAFKRYHPDHVAAGEPHPDCPFCDDAGSADSSGTNASTAETAAGSGSLSLEGLLSKVAELCDTVVVDGAADRTVAGYRQIYNDKITDAVAKYGPQGLDVGGTDLGSRLRDAVVEHAAAQLMPGRQVTAQRLRPLRASYGFDLIESMPTAAAKADRDVVAYLATLLKTRTEDAA